MFTWDINHCDSEIYNNGSVVMMCAISSKICNEFIEYISNITGCKVDYHYVGGRNVLKCLPIDYDIVSKYLKTLDDKIINKYTINEAGYLLY